MGQGRSQTQGLNHQSRQKPILERTHTFGICVPKTIQEALDIDKDNGNTLWADTIQKEMKNVMPAFKFLENNEAIPVGYKWIPCHKVLDVKMDFTRKACFVAVS